MARIYASISPERVFGYMPQVSNAHTPKLVHRKNQTLASSPADDALTRLCIHPPFLIDNHIGPKAAIKIYALHVKMKMEVVPKIKSETARIEIVIKTANFLPRYTDAISVIVVISSTFGITVPIFLEITPIEMKVSNNNTFRFLIYHDNQFPVALPYFHSITSFGWMKALSDAILPIFPFT